jgi:hypothetical protein
MEIFVHHGSKRLLIAAGIACGLLVVSAQAASTLPTIQTPVVFSQNTALNAASQHIDAAQHTADNVIPPQVAFTLLRAIPKMGGLNHVAQATHMTPAQIQALAEAEKQIPNAYGSVARPFEMIGEFAASQVVFTAALKLVGALYTKIKPFGSYMVDSVADWSSQGTLSAFTSGEAAGQSALAAENVQVATDTTADAAATTAGTAATDESIQNVASNNAANLADAPESIGDALEGVAESVVEDPD